MLRNLGPGPGQFEVNLRLPKSFSLGEAIGMAAGQSQSAAPVSGGHGGPGGHGEVHGGSSSPDGRYLITLFVSARYLFNTVNLAPSSRQS